MFYVHAHIHYMKNGEYPSHYFDDLYPLCSEQHYSECACIVRLYHAYSYTVEPKKAMVLYYERPSGQPFFLPSVLLEKKITSEVEKITKSDFSE